MIQTEKIALVGTQGCTFEEFFPIKDENDDDVDLTDGYSPTAIMELRLDLATAPVISLTTDNDRLNFEITPATGIRARISSADMEEIPAGVYYYDLIVNDDHSPESNRYVVARGTYLQSDHISELP